MNSRRVMITGLASELGGRLAQSLEREPQVETIVGVDADDPQHQLERTDFVRVDAEHGMIRRIVEAAAIDTLIDTRLVVDPLGPQAKRAHAINVAGTRNILAACDGPASGIRKLVFKSSAHYYGCGQNDPAFFSEEVHAAHPRPSALQRDVLQAEAALSEFAEANRRVSVTVLRFAEGVGGGLQPSHMALLGLPIVPAILGFDPRCQFIHEEDIVGVLAHAARITIPGTYNAAADGVLVLSEVASLLGKALLPVLPPWGTEFAASQLRRLGVPIPVELVRQLRFGRGLDNRRLKSTGYSYGYTTREALLKLRAHQRLRGLLRSGSEPYRYQREVEEFLRRSPSVQSARGLRAGAPSDWRDSPGPAEHPGVGSYDELPVGELIDLASSLEVDDLARLRSHEASHRARTAVLEALDRNLARRRS